MIRGCSGQAGTSKAPQSRSATVILVPAHWLHLPPAEPAGDRGLQGHQWPVLSSQQYLAKRRNHVLGLAGAPVGAQRWTLGNMKIKGI